MSTSASIVTTAELLAMSDDMERDLIRGELREWPMTRRNRLHASTEANIARILGNWLAAEDSVQARVLSGEVGTILDENPDTTVGIDVAVFPLEVLQNQSNETSLVRGAPILAVEILSPSDMHEDIHDKIVEYIRTGVGLVWEVDPDFRTVRVHRKDHEPVMFNRTQTISDPELLPGFEVSVGEFFPDWAT